MGVRPVDRERSGGANKGQEQKLNQIWRVTRSLDQRAEWVSAQATQKESLAVEQGDGQAQQKSP